MNIKVTNDGKKRAQSYEAEIELNSDNTYWGNFTSKFNGYGADEWSAKMNMVQQARSLVIILEELMKEVGN